MNVLIKKRARVCCYNIHEWSS